MSSATAKRPYVRPRIGRSLLRPLWYIAALAGVLVVAFIIPRTPPALPAMEGSWQLGASAMVAGLPAGSVQLLVAQGHYTLMYQAAAGAGGSGLEMGDLQEEGDRVIMIPRQGAYQNATGQWSAELPGSRSVKVRRDGERLVLTDGDGRVLQGPANSR
jgi:hypothetical protein